MRVLGGGGAGSAPTTTGLRRAPNTPHCQDQVRDKPRAPDMPRTARPNRRTVPSAFYTKPLFSIASDSPQNQCTPGARGVWQWKGRACIKIQRAALERHTTSAGRGHHSGAASGSDRWGVWHARHRIGIYVLCGAASLGILSCIEAAPSYRSAGS